MIPGVTTIPSKLSPRVLFEDGDHPVGVLAAAAAPTNASAQVVERILFSKRKQASRGNMLITKKKKFTTEHHRLTGTETYINNLIRNPGAFSLQAAQRVMAGVGGSGIRDVFGEPVGPFFVKTPARRAGQGRGTLR